MPQTNSTDPVSTSAPVIASAPESVASDSQQTTPNPQPPADAGQPPQADDKPPPTNAGQVTVIVGPSGGSDGRLVIAEVGGREIHRDRLDTSKATARKKFIKEIAKRMGAAPDELGYLEQDLLRQADAADAVVLAADKAGDGAPGDDSHATLIVRLADGFELFHSQEEEAFALVQVGDHRENWPVNGAALKRWLRREFYLKHKKVPGSQAISDAIGVLEGRALHDGSEVPVYLRVAEHEGAIYVDLGNDKWQAIKITAEGWEVVEAPPVRFRRPKGMRPLPIPKTGGSLADLWQFVNVREEDQPLVLAWLVQALNPRGPYPILALHGQHGSAKSSSARALRRLVDPHQALLRAEPRDVRDLAICAAHNWAPAFDNLSYLSQTLSDALCRLSTGGGFATRELYKDGDEVVFVHQRPVIHNGIEELANRADLLERSIVVDLPTIPEQMRKTEAEIDQAFEALAPQILGALCDAIATALKNLPATRLDTLPRMADFAVWAVASEPSWGVPEGAFLKAYEGNLKAMQLVPLESSPIVKPLQQLLAGFRNGGRKWNGTATALLEELTLRVDDDVKRRRNWPTNGQVLSNQLRRLAPNLKDLGIEVSFQKSGERRINLELLTKPAPPRLASRPLPEKPRGTVKMPRPDDERADDDVDWQNLGGAG